MKNRRQREAEEKALRETEYRKAVASMMKCEKELQGTIANSEAAAVRDEKAGNHSAAIMRIHSVRGLKSAVSRMTELRQRLEIMHGLCSAGETLNVFSSVCSDMMKSFNGLNNPANAVNIAGVLEKSEYQMGNLMDMFDGITSVSTAESAASDPEAEEYLRGLVAENTRAGGQRMAALTEKAFKTAQKN